jgi:hypothetical protein|tara:strand:- start:436 stop:717 length:282 start_codon:yes stop_codon:yes gene_type:complete
MFTTDTLVDTVHSAKKTWITTFVTNENIANSLNQFVDTQAEYTKKALKATSEVAQQIATETTKVLKESNKFDYVKFGEGIMKAYTAQNTAKAK